LNALGKHLLLELKDCNKEVLNDLNFVKDSLHAAANRCGATVVSEAFYQFAPYGISGVVIIAESHLFIHTWPEYGYAAADIFTCGDSTQPEAAAKLLVERLESKNPYRIELSRGILEGSQVSCEVK